MAGGIDADGLEGVAARLHLPQGFVAGGERLAVDQQRYVADGHAVGRANLNPDLLLIERDIGHQAQHGALIGADKDQPALAASSLNLNISFSLAGRAERRVFFRRLRYALLDGPLDGLGGVAGVGAQGHNLGRAAGAGPQAGATVDGDGLMPGIDGVGFGAGDEAFGEGVRARSGELRIEN